MTETVELKNCPFCQSRDVLPADSMSRTQIWCRSCNAEGPSIWHGGPTDDRATLNRCEAEAVAAWNTRSDPAVRGIVKPLEWRDDKFGSEAPSPVGRYMVEDMSANWLDDRYWLQCDRVIGKFGTASEAKAAAQADYEQRILSALEPRTSPTEPASGWMPIETAPKDGTVLLAITMEAQSPASRISWWDGDGWVRIWKAEKFVMPGPARWWPTHWQHLPAPPAKEPK